MGSCYSRSDTSSDIDPPASLPQTGRTTRSQSSTDILEGTASRKPDVAVADKGKGKSRPKDSRAKPRRSRPSSTPDGELIEMNTNSGAVLRTYATLPSPSSSLSTRVLLISTPSTIAIFDAFPKAKYHFLVLPRYPFPPQSDPDSTKSIVRLDHLEDLRTFLTKPTREAREQIVRQLADTAREVEEMIRDEMVKSEGFEWKIDVGFHAIPSLKHLHLHVISEDRISPALKTKKHYNSFRPDLGFFVSLADVQRWIMDDDEAIRDKVDGLLSSHSLLSSPLTCFKCDEPYHNIPKLKSHLEKEFAAEKKKALENIRRSGRQRSSDEDMF